MRILQINVSVSCGSTGRIAEGIGCVAQEAGFDSWIAYGRTANRSSSKLIRIGTKFDYLEHGLETRILDNHGLASRLATYSFLREVNQIRPDIVHLHNIHGYYLNYKILFDYLSKKNNPIVWTLHDCWPITGHCAHFSAYGCEKWKTGCNHCSQSRTYPASLFADNSEKNYRIKKESFTSVPNLTIVSVSHWLDRLIGQSFLKKYRHIVIHNGIDTAVFSPREESKAIRSRLGIGANETMLLGVANVWSKCKGFDDFIELSKHLPPLHKIVLIGLNEKQFQDLPENIIGIKHTESTEELAAFYSAADLFLNLTYEDTYPTTNLEAISCGIPCLTYRTGGSPESITPKTGFVVEQGDIKSVLETIKHYKSENCDYKTHSRNYAITFFDQKQQFSNYITLYNNLV